MYIVYLSRNATPSPFLPISFIVKSKVEPSLIFSEVFVITFFLRDFTERKAPQESGAKGPDHSDRRQRPYRAVEQRKLGAVSLRSHDPVSKTDVPGKAGCPAEAQ